MRTFLLIHVFFPCFQSLDIYEHNETMLEFLKLLATPPTLLLNLKHIFDLFLLRFLGSSLGRRHKKCNIFQSGQQYLFSVALNRLHGEGTADALYVMSKQTRKYSTGELRAMIEIYKTKVEDIRRDKGLE